MDANRYFEEMHKAMTAQKSALELLLTAKYQDAAGCDAYIELRYDAARHTARIYYTTMGRKYLNFQLFRKGWQLCHNEAGEQTGHFPATADGLIQQTDFHAFCRDEAFDADKAARILHEMERHSGEYAERLAPRGGHEESSVTIDSYIGAGAHWAYSGAPDEACLPAAAILYWLADYLAGGERRALQSSTRAAHLAAQWEMEMQFAKTATQPCAVRPQSRPSVQNAPARSRRPAQNERWQSILAVLSTV